MFQSITAQAEDFDTARAAGTILAQCRKDLGGRKPSAALLFAAVQFDHRLLLDEIVSAFPGIPLAGCTTSGEFSSRMGFSFDSAVLVLLLSDTVTFSAGYAAGAGTDSARAAAEAYKTAAAGLPESASLCLLFADGVTADAAALVEETGSQVPEGCPVFGATSARQVELEEPTRQFCGGSILEDTAVTLLMSGPVRYGFSIANGWRPLGPRVNVTSSSGRDVKRIGDRTALEFYRRYLGPGAEPALEFPLAVFEPGSDDFHLRVPHGFDEKTGSILFRGGIPAGATVQLTEAVRNNIVTDLKNSVESAGTGQDFNPALGLAFSCRVRNLILGTRISDEYRALKAMLPENLPLAGFYGFGEFSPLQRGKKSLLHNSTMVTLLLGDDETPEPAGDHAEPYDDHLLDNAGYLLRRLKRVQQKRKRAERQLDYSASMQRTIMTEVIQAHEKIEQQNQELQGLYAELAREKSKSDQLLLNILPDDVAEELKATGKVEPVHFDAATVMFSDFKDFTTIAENVEPARLVRELDEHFSRFDRIIERHGLEKLKTIGDAYMCAGGLPTPSETHAADTVRAALEMLAYMEKSRAENNGPDAIEWELRIGINTGPLMAGVIGKKKFAYDIWGDTVNIAARMEAAGQPGRINISGSTAGLVGKKFKCVHRGQIYAKNKGNIDMYFVAAPEVRK